jgi:hypothetical protein
VVRIKDGLIASDERNAPQVAVAMPSIEEAML